MPSQVPLKGDIVKVYNQAGDAKLEVEGTISASEYAGVGDRTMGVDSTGKLKVIPTPPGGSAGVAGYLDGAP